MHRLSLDRAQQLLDAMRHVRVLVLGDVMLDVYLRGVASRISPEAPVPVVRVEEETRAVGGAANVAANIIALGARCELVGCIGADQPGDQLLQELKRHGIGAHGIVAAPGRPTTVKTRIMARHQQVARFDQELDVELPESVCGDIVERCRGLLSDVDAVVLEDYNKGLLTRSVIRSVLAAAREAGRPVVVDPKSRHFFDYRGCTVFKPNMAELSAALRLPIEPDQREWLEDVRAQIGCDHLLVTLGEDGMTLLTSDGEHVRVPTVARSVYDVSGAGDTVTAVLGMALAAGASVIEAAIIANHAAGIEVGKAGVATVSPDELLAMLEQPLAVRSASF
jgi:D-beta-D-heptose 7-phosphate kinase/D-beta-D-heptose 1-phosphate adenosyltransferase